MNFEQVDKLKFDTKLGLFNINQPVFVFRNGTPLFPHFVEKEEEMRMDLISNRLYQTTEHVVFLCRLNNIINPLNIKEGTLLLWVEENNIKSFTPPDETFVEEVKQTFVNLNKKRRVDTKRQNYNNIEDNRVSLPPVFNDVEVDNVILGDDGIITIGPGNVG